MLIIMTIERELLKRFMTELVSLFNDIKECLAQPEPTAEPVGYLYKQMDCYGEWATIFKVDKPYITWHDIKDIVPVYTAPPKREPLSSIKILELTSKHEYAINLIRAVEKAHGIGGGE